MTSVETSVSFDTLEALKMYQPFLHSSQTRKHFKEVEKQDLPRSNRPALERVSIPDKCQSLKCRSPLSPSRSSRSFPQTASISASKTVTCPFAPIKQLFISPHPDDICYSCFSTVSKGNIKEEENLNGQRVIVTVFSKSRCANGELGQQLNRSIPDITRVRKIEDEEFAEMVGCKLYQLDQPDSSARDEYSRWTHLADQDIQEQHRVVKAHSHYPETVKALSPIVRWAVQCKADIYMPLGVGCHVDHLLTRVAVTCIFDEIKLEKKQQRLSIKLTYYEDLPYAFYVTEESIQNLAKTVLDKSAKSFLISVDEDCWEKKKKAVLTYATQIKSIIIPALHDRAITLAGLEEQGGSNLKERIWTV